MEFPKLEGLWVLFPWTSGAMISFKLQQTGKLPGSAELSVYDPSVWGNSFRMWLPSAQMTQASCTDWSGCSRPASLILLRSSITSLEMVRPTQTVMLHRYPAVIHSDLEWFNLTYCRPPSQFCLFTSLPIFHVIPLIMLSNTIHNPILDLHHWPIAPLRFSSLLLGLVFLKRLTPIL